MSKLLLSGIAIALISLAGNTQAQVPPSTTTPTPQSQPGSPTSTPLKATDLPLLTRAIGKFWQTDTAETESQMEIDSSDGKGTTKYLVSVKTIAKVGRKFRSELTILHRRGSANDRVDRKSKIKYTIVSDGKKVWIYRPDIRQYFETTTDEFGKEPSGSIIGFFSLSFIIPKEAERESMIADILGENNQIISVENLKFLQVLQQQIDNQKFSVYTYGNEEIKISGYINPQTAMFERNELKFGDKQKRIQIVEKIVKRNSQPVITYKTFTFLPTKGVKKVKSLQVDPFTFK